MNYEFEKWWKSQGRFEEIVNNDFRHEDIYKKFAEKVWNNHVDNNDKCHEDSCSCHQEFFD